VKKWVGRIGLAWCLVAAPARADDAGYSGDGVTVYPLDNTAITLVSETIDIEARRHEWRVDVTLRFENATSRAQTVQMGFPFESWAPGEEEPGDPGFKTWVDGAPQKVTRRKGLPHPQINDFDWPIVFTTRVAFQPHQQRSVRHTYTVTGYGDSSGDTRNLYILRTGSLWRGPISTAVVHLRTPVGQARWLQNVEPEPQHVGVGAHDVTLDWTFENFEPDFDIVVTRSDRLDSALPGMADALDEYPDLVAPRHLQYFINRIYATYGYPFQKPLVRAMFYGAPDSPYHERKDFKPGDIPERYVRLIAKLQRVAAGLPADITPPKPPPPPPPAPKPAPVDPTPIIDQAMVGRFDELRDGSLVLAYGQTVPNVPGRHFGWILHLKTAQDTVTVVEELELPAAPATWGGVEPGSQSVSADGRTLRTTLSREVWQGAIRHTYSVAPGDPSGRYVFRIWVEGQGPVELPFAVEDVPAKPRPPAKPGLPGELSAPMEE
jgi:hypothetical protein